MWNLKIRDDAPLSRPQTKPSGVYGRCYDCDFGDRLRASRKAAEAVTAELWPETVVISENA